MNKNAQFSLEFLTTYGWAFILMTIMIGGIIYFGVLNPKQNLPDRCLFSVDFECNDFKITDNVGATDELKLKLKNNVGQAIKVNSMAINSEKGVIAGCVAYHATLTGDVVIPDPAFTWNDGNLEEFTFKSCDFDASGITRGNKKKISIKIQIYYATSSSTFLHNADGEVLGTVQ